MVTLMGRMSHMRPMGLIDVHLNSSCRAVFCRSRQTLRLLRLPQGRNPVQSGTMISPHNPFPGMNPFLEASWSDVHTQLIAYLRDELALRGLPPGLRARTEENLNVEEESIEETRSMRPDVAVMESWKLGVPPSWKPGGEERGPVALAEPKIVLREPEPERWIEITSIHGKRITVIELLSLSNKTGAGRERYAESGRPTKRPE